MRFCRLPADGLSTRSRAAGMSLAEVLVSLVLVLVVLVSMLALFSWWRRARHRIEAVRDFLAVYRASLYWVERDTLAFRQAWREDPAWSAVPLWFGQGFTHDGIGITWLTPAHQPPAVLAASGELSSPLVFLDAGVLPARRTASPYVVMVDGMEGAWILLRGHRTDRRRWTPEQVLYRSPPQVQELSRGARGWSVDVLEYHVETLGATGVHRMVRRRNGVSMVLMPALERCRWQGLALQHRSGMGWPRLVCHYRDRSGTDRPVSWTFVLEPAL